MGGPGHMDVVARALLTHAQTVSLEELQVYGGTRPHGRGSGGAADARADQDARRAANVSGGGYVGDLVPGVWGGEGGALCLCVRGHSLQVLGLCEDRNNVHGMALTAAVCDKLLSVKCSGRVALAAAVWEPDGISTMPSVCFGVAAGRPACLQHGVVVVDVIVVVIVAVVVVGFHTVHMDAYSASAEQQVNRGQARPTASHSY
eukprot:366465-Chlamydomonas_euryale.AAC.22